MWRTAATLLLLVAVGTAVQNVEQMGFVAADVLTDNGPVQARLAENVDQVNFMAADVIIDNGPVQARVAEHSEPLVAEAPLNTDSNKFLQGLRVMRSNVLPQALSAVGLGHGNQLDDQKTYELPITGKTVTLNFGKTTPTAINTVVSLESDAVFVYGKSCAAAGACRKTAPKTTFDESKSTKDTAMPNTFNFNYQMGSASGVNYKDTIAVANGMSVPMVFGVANAGKKDADMIDADGFIGLGFQPVSGPKYRTVQNLFTALAPNQALTIWKKSDLSSGVINLGDVTYKECPSKKTDLVDAVKDKAGNQRWWFKADKIEANGKSVDAPIVKISMDFDNFEVPKDIYDQIKPKLDGTSMIDDASKLPKIKLTIGKDVVELDGSTYSLKVGDKYLVMLTPTTGAEYHVMLGNGLLSKACVVLKQKDKTGTAFQMGLIYGNSSAKTALSVLSLVMLPLVYLMGL